MADAKKDNPPTHDTHGNELIVGSGRAAKDPRDPFPTSPRATRNFLVTSTVNQADAPEIARRILVATAKPPKKP